MTEMRLSQTKKAFSFWREAPNGQKIAQNNFQQKFTPAH
jgi:hypothetical protein